MINYENYLKQESSLPHEGRNIIGQYDDDSIVVYQAYNNKIADYAIQHQTFGGAAFSYNRMTWIKPNFLWMMYRAGWASKTNQERILAIRLKKSGFIDILNEAVHSRFEASVYKTMELWKSRLSESEVRLQWDPDHDPFGNKKERKAIQLGLKGEILEKYCSQWILEISDITDFVRNEKNALDTSGVESLTVPSERVFEDLSSELITKLQITQKS